MEFYQWVPDTTTPACGSPKTAKSARPLLPNRRYIEARGHLEAAYQGNYQIVGNHIEYQDDTGFVADGDFIAGVLHHADMVMYARD